MTGSEFMSPSRSTHSTGSGGKDRKYEELLMAPVICWWLCALIMYKKKTKKQRQAMHAGLNIKLSCSGEDFYPFNVKDISEEPIV